MIFLLATAATAESPTEKVVKMLEDFKTETETEQATEKQNFEKYSAWCDDTSGKKKTAIKEGKDNLQELEGSIEGLSSNYEQLIAELRELASRKERLETEKVANLKQCEKDKKTADASKADLNSAVGGLQAAIKTLMMKKGTPSLLQSSSSLQRSLELAEAMGFLQEPKRQELVAFLQAGKDEPWLEKKGEHYNKEEYSFQSDGIVNTLKDLESQFTAERDAVVKEWTATQALCDKTDTDKKTALEDTAKSSSGKDAQSNVVKESLGAKKQELLATRKTLKEDQAFLQSVEADCTAREADYDQRSKNRAGEIEAIAAALKVMKDTVQDLETSVKESALVQTRATVIQRQAVLPSFFQQKSARATDSHAAAQVEAHTFETPTRKAVSFLAKAGVNLKSFRLSEMAVRMQQQTTVAADPLTLVKEMTEKMLDGLQKEALAETSQKGFCDTQMMKASKERDRRHREAMSQDKKMKAAGTKRIELLETVELQTSSISELEKALSDATQLRVADSEANLKTIKDATEGASAVDNAIKALKSFYAKAQRSADRYEEAAAFLQKTSQTTKEDPGFDGSYAGKQNTALGFVTLMETIRDDFKKTLKETKAEEDEEAEKFTKLKVESKSDIESKRTSLALNKEELSVTTNDLASGKTSLQSTVKLLDAALSALEGLKDECVNNKMTYEERKAKREQEIADLKTAMCILDPNSVEPECADKSS